MSAMGGKRSLVRYQGAMSEASLFQLVQSNNELLANFFDGAPFEIVESTDPVSCVVRSDWVEIELIYDWRDQWLSAVLKPLHVSDDVSDPYDEYNLRKFCGIEEPDVRKGALDSHQLTDCLIRIRPIVEKLKDSQAARDAVWYVRGYSHAYTDFASGKWD
jgi:hypothetical protein